MSDSSSSPRESTTESSDKSLISQPKKSKMHLFFKQLIILLWKSCIVRKVHYITTFIEIFLPIVLVLLFAYINANINIGNNNDAPNNPNDNQMQNDTVPATIFKNPQFTINFESGNPLVQNLKIFYTPDDDIIAKLMKPLVDVQYSVIGCTDESEVHNKVMQEASNIDWGDIYPFILGINFEKNNQNNGQLAYKVFLPIRPLAKTKLNPLPMKLSAQPVMYSYSSDFNTPIVEVISKINQKFLTQYSKNQTKLESITVNRMPYPSYKKPKYDLFSIYDLLAQYILITFLLICPIIIRRITDEKSSKSKEMLRMVGMSDVVFWASHFLNHFMILVWQFFIFLIIFHYYPVNPLFPNSAPSIMFLVMVMFGIQMILYSMLITTVFNKPTIAVIVSLFIWGIGMALIFRNLVPSVNKGDSGNSAYGLRVLTSFVPFGSLIWLIGIIGSFESLDTGMTFDKLNRKANVYGDFTLLHCITSVFVSYFVYIFLIWYLDNVWPWQHGVPKSPFYLFSKSYWFPTKSRKILERPELDPKTFEPDPIDLNPDIEIQNVTKVFSSFNTAKKIAVNNLWLNIYRNQLTVLLGHNGAGKSTTMNMITGLFKANKGDIYVDGFNVFVNTNEARRSIGLCPQENILFKELTVYQHLKLYAILKDHPFSSVNQEVIRVLNLLQLAPKKNVLATKLSGGMQRKLQLGIALIGKTKILILDEPTSGLDPEARRIIWDVLIEMRREKTILLTTHYMEEADVLGDRIAIMNEGKLCCCGSPYFLKNAFGTGYQLRIEKMSDFNSNSFLKILKKYISTASLKSEIETEVIYNFGEKSDTKSQMLKNFPILFDDIEKNRRNYGINSFGLTYSTLEDVFIAVESDFSIFKHENSIQNENKKLQQIEMVPKLTKSSQLLTGHSLIIQQFFALLVKRFHYTRRHWQMFMFLILIPGLTIAFAIMLNSSISNVFNDNVPPIEYNLESLYGPNAETYYQGSQKLYESYKRINSRYEASTANIPEANDFEKSILSQNKEDLNHYTQKVVYGLKTNSTRNYGIWFNAEQTHSVPLSSIALFQSLLEEISPQDFKKDVSIDVSLKPVVVEEKSDNNNPQYLNLVNKVISWVLTCLILLPLAFPYLAASYIQFPITERVSKSKLMQLMTGLSPALFWIGNFVFDLIIHMIAVTILYLIIMFLDSNRLFFDENSKSSAGVLFVLLFAFGVATIPFTYLFSFLFDVPSSGFTYTVIIFMLLGLIVNIFWSVLDLLNNNFDLGFAEWNVYFLPIIRIIPIFSLLFGYQKLFKANTFANFCKDLKNQGALDTICNGPIDSISSYVKGCCENICEKDNSCFDSGSFSFGKFGSGWEITYLFLSGLLYLSLLIICEYKKQYIQKCFSSFSKKKLSPIRQSDIPDDSDVIEEKERVKQLIRSPEKFSTDQLLVYDLTKKFGNFTAVDHLTFGIHHDECFGLLGINGAGKTTTFSMLTGDLFPTYGEAWMDGNISLIGDMHRFQQNIGYCPQFDALLDNLTGEEMLYLIASLRGVPRKNLPYDVPELVKMVDLQAHVKKTTQQYSGGNKRKLSIALSLIGNPPLLFLDEPTTGVDPVARRKVWKTLEMIKNNFDSSIILTSHSMEECEALCSRIAIMVGGKFRCLGSTQHLRQKYSQGYTIIVRLKREHEKDSEYNDLVKRRLFETLPSSSLKDSHQCLMQFHVTDKDIPWSELFRKMAELNEELELEDYVVSDTTLESIFIMFARSQRLNNS